MRYPTNPREARAHIHGVYESYAQGQTMFPTSRLVVPVEALAPKTQPIAQALVKAWEVIDDDRAYVTQSIVNFDQALRSRQDWGEAHGIDRQVSIGIIVAKIGINAVTHTMVQVPEDPEAATEYSTDRYWTHEFTELTRRGMALELSDGTVSTWNQDGDLITTAAASSIAVIDRLSGPSTLYMAPPTQAEAA